MLMESVEVTPLEEEFKDTSSGSIGAEIFPFGINQDDAQQEIDGWVGKQDFFWPEELDSKVLSSGIEEVYAVYFRVECTGKANWSASIGKKSTGLMLSIW